MKKIKAIDTVYDGLKFRSRLEARWAVFFKFNRISYSYEPEGFELPHGWYLPDLWLPDHKIWVEIKQGQPTEDEMSLARDLSSATGHGTLVLAGTPWPGSYRPLFITDEREWPDCIRYNVDPPGDSPDPSSSDTHLARCRKCDGLWLVDEEYGCSSIGEHHCGDRSEWPLTFGPDDFSAARRARFEHGESPCTTNAPRR